jgi:hypothetical protein
LRHAHAIKTNRRRSCDAAPGACNAVRVVCLRKLNHPLRIKGSSKMYAERDLAETADLHVATAVLAAVKAGNYKKEFAVEGLKPSLIERVMGLVAGKPRAAKKTAQRP